MSAALPLGGKYTLQSFRSFLGEDYDFEEVWHHSMDFSTASTKLCGHQNVVLLVELSNGHLVGGYSKNGFKINQNVTDSSAFVFRLLINGQEKMKKSSSSGSAPLYCTTAQLSFGGDIALQSNGTVSIQASNFVFDDSMNAVQNAVSPQQYNYGANIWIYQKASIYHLKRPSLLKAPFLQITFSDKEYKQLHESLLEDSKKFPKDVPKANILLAGPAGAGKSSFINSIESIGKGRFTELAQSGRGVSSVTLQLRRYILWKYPFFALYDTMGWDQKSYNSGEFGYILDGNIPNGMPLDKPITPKTTGFNNKPSLKEEMHSMVMLLPAADAHDEQHLKRIRALRDLGRARDIRMILLISHIDSFEKDIAESLKNVVRSNKLKSLIETLYSETGIPKTSIFPLKNHCEGFDLSEDQRTLLLKVLRLIMDRTLDCFDAKALHCSDS